MLRQTATCALGSRGDVLQISGKTAFLQSARTPQQLEQDFAKHSHKFQVY